MASSNLLEVFANNPSTTVSAGGTTNVGGVSGTVETWTVASSASFPTVLTGSSQFHVADPSQPSEMIAVTAVSGTTWTVTRGAESSTPVAHSAGFTVAQVATAGVLGLMLAANFEFNVQAYGAKGDGQCVTDGAMSSTVSTTTLTCATSTPFKASDVGKNIMIVGAATTSPNVNTLVTTITGYTSSSVVTVGAACATTVSGATVLWSSDDTAAFQSAINAACTWAQANLCDVVVTIPNAPGVFWGIAGPLVTGSPTFGNAQLTLPVIPIAGQKVALTIQGIGTVPGGTGQYHWSQVPPQFNGSTIVSYGIFQAAATMGTSVTTSGNPCVIGGPDFPAGYGQLSGPFPLFSNMVIVLMGLVIMTPLSLDALNYTAFNFFGVAQANIIDCCLTAATTYNQTWATKTMTATGFSIGGIMPANGNNDNNVIDRMAISGGFRRGLFATEHTVCHRLMILYCYSAFCPVGSYGGSVGALHAIYADQISVEGCTNLVEVIGSGASGRLEWHIAQLDTEGTPSFIDDGSGGMAGSVGTIQLTGEAPLGSFAVAPTLMEIVSNLQAPGFATWTLVASTAFQNPGWRWANVTMVGGATVTAVNLGATRGGTTAPTMTAVYTQASGVLPPLTVRVPPGGWISVTCGTIPTHTVVYD